MQKTPVQLALLYDLYGEVLTEKQKDVFELYYNNDYSLAEIAEHIGMTRQGVRYIVKRAEEILCDMEDRLGLLANPGQPNTEAAGVFFGKGDL